MNKLLSTRTAMPGIMYPTIKQDYPSIEYVRFDSDHNKEDTLSFTEIILVTEGRILLSYDHFLNKKINKGKIILLSPGCHFTIRTDTPASALRFRFKEAIRLCEGYTIDRLSGNKSIPVDQINSLDSKSGVEAFALFLKDNMQKGLCQEDYLKLKAEELLYLLRSYYTAEELKQFFLPLLSPDARFHQFVLCNYRKIKTVKQFADLNNCSVSNFDKKFREAFGASAYQWMQKKKVNLLYHEINATDKPLNQIAKEQKFLSLPQFNDYCKKHFGYPPGKMRKLSSMFRDEKKIS